MAFGLEYGLFDFNGLESLRCACTLVGEAHLERLNLSCDICVGANAVVN